MELLSIEHLDLVSGSMLEAGTSQWDYVMQIASDERALGAFLYLESVLEAHFVEWQVRCFDAGLVQTGASR